MTLSYVSRYSDYNRHATHHAMKNLRSFV